MEAYIIENENAYNVAQLLEAGYTVKGYPQEVTETGGDLYQYIGQYNDDNIVIEYGNGQDFILIQGYYYYAVVTLESILQGELTHTFKYINGTCELGLQVGSILVFIEGLPAVEDPAELVKDKKALQGMLSRGYLYTDLQYYID